MAKLTGIYQQGNEIPGSDTIYRLTPRPLADTTDFPETRPLYRLDYGQPSG